jgi:hypothetical protein
MKKWAFDLLIVAVYTLALTSLGLAIATPTETDVSLPQVHFRVARPRQEARRSLLSHPRRGKRPKFDACQAKAGVR